MFGGFNQDYYNDLHYINVGLSATKPKKQSEETYEINKFIDNQEISDITVSTSDNENFYCHKGFMRKIFENEEHLDNFIKSINGVKTR